MVEDEGEWCIHYDKFVHMYGDELSSLVLVWGSHGCWGAQVRRIVGYIPKHMSSPTSETPSPLPSPHQGLSYCFISDCFTPSSGIALLPRQGLFYFLIRACFTP